MSTENVTWTAYPNEFEDILFEKAALGNGYVAKLTINRPEVHNAFHPTHRARAAHRPADRPRRPRGGRDHSHRRRWQGLCSGGDQRVRSHGGYVGGKDGDVIPRLNVLDFQREIRSCPKPVVAMVAGWAIGGGHVLHVICDLSIAADNARFGQTGPKVGSFDGGFGASYLARIVGQKKAREIWFTCRQYDAQKALDMGLVNEVVPLDELESCTLGYCAEMLQHSPLALRCLKSSLNADCDGQAGLQELAGNATLLYYMSEEGKEGHSAYLEKRKPDFTQFPRFP